MKKLLLSGICLVAISGTSKAQLAVTDAASLFQQIQILGQQVKSYAVEAQQLATMASQLQQEVNQYKAFVHDPTIGAAMGLMNSAGLSNSLPINPNALQALVSGNTNPSSILGALGSLSGTSYSANHVYSPTDGSWNSQQLIANGNGIAGTQGAAQALYQDLRNHMPIIQSLRDRLMTATTPKDVADVHAEIDDEALWTQSAHSQLSAIDIAYKTQQDYRAQKDNESLDQGIDSFIKQANAAGRGIN